MENYWVFVFAILLFLKTCVVQAQLSGNEQLTPELANILAERILTNIHNIRHQHIYFQLRNPETLKVVKAMRENLINTSRGNPIAKVFKDLSAEDYLKKLVRYLDDWKHINTVAVMKIGNKVLIAGNVKTMELPLDPRDSALFEKIARGEEPKKVVSGFQIQDLDAPAIRTALKDSNIRNFFGGIDPAVLVLTPDGESLEEDYFIRSRKEVRDKHLELIQEVHREALRKLEDQVRASSQYQDLETKGQKEALVQEKVRFHEERHKKNLWEAEKMFRKDNRGRLPNDYDLKMAHAYHAEMQLLHEVKKLNPTDGETAVLGVSKLICEKCEIEIVKSDVGGRPGNSVIDYDQDNRVGKPAATTPNWELPPEIKATELKLNVPPQPQPPTLATNEADFTPSSADASSCSTRRRKRSLSGCVKLDTKEFIQEYVGGDEKIKSQLGEYVRTADVDLVGGDEDVKNVKSLGKLEDIKAKNKATSASKFKTVWKDLKSGVGKVKTKISSSKLAGKISGLVNTKAFSKVSAGVNIGSAPISLFLLGKSVVNGVIHKDCTTLGILGGRLGIEAIEWGAKGVTQLAKAGSTLGKTTKFLGKAAGPVGAFVDVGLSTWSLGKAVERLVTANNTYDKNDAIADIVGSSVDITITTVAVAAIVAFPPAGIVIAVVGVIVSFVTQLAVALFKTQNEIDKINSEVPLLDFEKSEQFKNRFFDWFGTREKDYIDDLVTVKKMNDAFIKHNLDFLHKHPNLSGIAFPARSIAYQGSCRFVRRHCGLKHIGGCTWNFEPDVVMATGCDHGQMCDGHPCVDYSKSTGTLGYNDFKCICDQASNVEEGYPRLDNYIDFREKRNVFHERAVQKGVRGADFKCQPGHESYQNFRISERSMSLNFLCRGTIALYQKNRGGQTFYFDLEDGKDTVLLDESKTEGNTFLVGNGEKYFRGGAGRDDFILHPNTSKVTGNLFGGDGENSLVLSDGFKKGSTLTFHENHLREEGEDLDVSLSTEGITEIVGRAEDAEIVSPSCEMERLQLRGGSSSQMDVVDLEHFCPSDKTLTIISEGNTLVKSLDVISRNFQVISIPVRGGKRFEAQFSEGKGFDATLFIGHTSGNLSRFDYRQTNPGNYFRTEMNWKEINTQYQYSLSFYQRNTEAGGIKVAFIEGDNLYSRLSFGSGKPSVTHALTNAGNMRRSGAPDLANNFLLQSGSWSVDCGKGSEGHFILYPEFRRGQISCGKETKESSLSFHESHETPVRVDLNKGVMGDISFKGIRAFYGRQGVQEEVIAGCDTEVLATQGGTKISPDIIDLSSRTECISLKPLVVTCQGITILREIVKHNKLPAVTLVNILDSPGLNLTAIISTESKTSFNFFLPELSLSKKEVVSSPNQIQMSLGGRNGQLVNFHLNSPRKLSGILPGPEIIIRNNASEYNGHLILDAEGDAKIVHFLTEIEGTCKAYFGVEGVVNIFKILEPCWQVTGAPGNSDSGNTVNYFVLEVQNDTVGISISGGLSNLNNNLIVEKFGDEGKYALFDFKYERLGHGFAKTGRLRGIQHFMGREEKPDDITLSCDSEIISVDGRSGGIGKPDRVRIPEPLYKEKCTSEKIQKIIVKKETEVDNTATVGNYLYEIELESGLDTVRVQPSRTNHHIFQYKFLPSKIIQGAHYTPGNQTLELQFEFGWNLSYPIVFHPGGRMNPEIRFLRRDEAVLCDIIVEQEKEQVMAKWDIRGIENIQGLQVSLNAFLINVSPSKETKTFSQRVIGKERNEFWLLSFPKRSLLQLYGSSPFDEMHLSDDFFSNEVLILDLSDGESRIFLENEKRELVWMDGIQKFYGRPEKKDVVWPGCDTSFLANMDEIVLHPDSCIYFFHMDLIIHPETEVKIFTKNVTLSKMYDFPFVEEPKGEFRYHFQEPCSFTPFTDWRYPNQFQSSNHTYFLPLTLGQLTSIEFLPWSETLRYKIDGKEVTHRMLVDLEDIDEFYRQPKFVTEEGCEIRVGRSSEIVAICKYGNFSAGELSESARRLGLSVILLKDDEITYAGHNSVDDRNVLTTSRGMKNHLNGGAAMDTIYEIKFLEKDVIINSGFIFENDPPEMAKHTIDLTDIIVPLRIQEKNKYVPKVEKIGEDLIISLPEYEEEIPGKITILNGVEQSSLFQILLNSAMMQLKPLSETAENGARRKREAVFDEFDGDWIISPVPIEVEPGSVFSLSQEDLEDGHSILLDKVEVDENLTSFTASRDEADLHLSDTSAEGSDPTVIIIFDFFPQQSEGENQKINSSIPALDVSINLPGFEILLEKSVLFENFSSEIPGWDEVLEETEEELLQDLPDIPRVFKIHRPPSPLLICLGAFALLFVLIFCVVIILKIRRSYCWSYQLKISDYSAKKTKSLDAEPCEVKQFLEDDK